MLEPESHRERVCRYCELLAAHVGLDPGVLRAAGWLHDVGMVALTLPAGAVSAADRRALELHPAVAHALLAGAGHEPLDTRPSWPGRTTSASTATATRAA